LSSGDAEFAVHAVVVHATAKVVIANAACVLSDDAKNM
jgi:hypothetical protein